MLKRLAPLREQATKEERERYRYKLVLGDANRNAVLEVATLNRTPMIDTPHAVAL